MMILDLDIGNSRIKWRVSAEDRAVRDEGVALQTAQLFSATIETHAVTRVRIACVRGGTLLSEVVQALEQRRLPVARATVQRTCHGLTVAYNDLSRLGVDRWLAMLGAFKQSEGACVVVDCGTAMTIDLVNTAGLHLGGYIVPGLRLLPQALTEHTAIRLLDKPEWGLEPGNSTEQAVYNGALNLLLSTIRQTVERELSRLSAETSPSVFLTGGDASLLGGFLSLPGIAVREVPGLVFEGLDVALP